MRRSQQPSEADTGKVSVEDETLATNRSATAVPYGAGEMKTAIRWITPIYGQSVVKEARKANDKK